MVKHRKQKSRIPTPKWGFDDSPELAAPLCRYNYEECRGGSHMIAEAYAPVFEDRMLKHLRRHFPDRCESFSDGGTRELIREGMRRAKRYGLHGQGDVCRYIDLMFLFGRKFDSDPNYTWTRSILDDATENPTSRMDRLVIGSPASLNSCAAPCVV